MEEAGSSYSFPSITISRSFHQNWLMIFAVSRARRAQEQKIPSGGDQFEAILRAIKGASLLPLSFSGRSASLRSGLSQDDFA